MLLLCYSLIDTNTIPFYFSLSQIGRAEPHTQRFGLTVSSRRCPSSFYESYPTGRTSASTLLMIQLVQAVIPPQRDAYVGVQSSSGALKHLALKCQSEMFNCVSLTNSHTRRDAFVETNPPAGLSSIHNPILGRV